MAGSWKEAEKLAQAEKNKQQWRPLSVSKIVNESSEIKSFYLQPDSEIKFPFEPGQFLTIQGNVHEKEHIRTYSLSSAPADSEYRISVKRDGVFSSFLHDEVKVGDVLNAKAPTGAFTYDAAEVRPAVLLSAGVGITPMVSIARHAMSEAIRTRSLRPLTIFAAAKNAKTRAFKQELKSIEEQSGGQISTYWTLSDEPNVDEDFQHAGRISADLLQSVLPIADYEFYLCGPASFMQSMYGMLRNLGVSDNRIKAEAFGPASLQRDVAESETGLGDSELAVDAIVEYAHSGVEQRWSPADGSLLEFSEAHGFEPEFGCRSGQCGACKVQLVSGEVSYQSAVSADLAEDEILLCCAKPAAVAGEGTPRLILGL